MARLEYTKLQETVLEKYVYTLVQEDVITGEQAERKRKYYTSEPRLEIGRLYSGMALGRGFPGYRYYRVLDVEKKLVPGLERKMKTGVDPDAPE